jgi:hypothetical protein
MEHPQNESTPQRAKRDTISCFSTIRFWIFDILITAGLTVWVLLWTPHFGQDWYKIVYQVMVPILGATSGLGIVFLISLFLAPYKQRNEARIELRNTRTALENLQNKKEEKPSPKLIAIYKVLSLSSDGHFDCRVFINNKGTESAKNTIVAISFLNIEIITTLWGDNQPIDKLRHNIPTIQWNSTPLNVIPCNATLHILDLKLKIKDVNQVGTILSTMYADDMDATANIYTLNISEIKVIEDDMKKVDGSSLKGWIDIKPEIIQNIIRLVAKQDIDKGGSQT